MTGTPTRRAVDVTHLIGRPWEEADCAAIARAALAACGLEVPGYAFARFEDNDELALQRYLGATFLMWVQLGATADVARCLGDVLVSRTPAGTPHLSVLVDEVARKAITTAVGSGAMLVPVASIRNVERVIRWAS